MGDEETTKANELRLRRVSSFLFFTGSEVRVSTFYAFLREKKFPRFTVFFFFHCYSPRLYTSHVCVIRGFLSSSFYISSSFPFGVSFFCCLIPSDCLSPRPDIIFRVRNQHQ